MEIVNNLAKSGNNVILIAMTSQSQINFYNGAKQRIICIPLRYFPILTSIIYTILLSLILPIHILHNNPDLIIFDSDFSMLSSVPNAVITKLRKTKLVLDIRSVPVETYTIQAHLNKLFFNISVLIAKSMFQGITTITTEMKKEICSQFLIPPNKVGTWSSGVSASHFNPSIWKKKGNELRKNFDLLDKFVVFYHGRLSEGRGIIETVEAVKIWVKKNPNIILFLLGTGPIVHKLTSLIKENNIEKNVIIHNPVDYKEVPAFIAMCDVCIIPLPDHPDWRSQSPLKLFEYLSMEKVVIATDIPSHKKILDKTECRLYLQSTTPEEIAKVVQFALTIKPNFEKLGNSGRSIILNNYTWESVAKDLENYLLSL